LTNEQVIQIIQNLQSEVISRDKQINEMMTELNVLKQSNTPGGTGTNVVEKDILERYEQLLQENRELRRQLDDRGGGGGGQDSGLGHDDNDDSYTVTEVVMM
jgi:hypothetical protein